MNVWLVRALSIAGILAVLVGIGLLLPEPPAKTVTVTRTTSGFEPAHVTIRLGDSVRFVTTTRSAFWPASDSHPSHLLYADFDPQRPIEPGESWTFTFDKPGSWEFHDHMHSQFTGVVEVLGRVNHDIEKCVEEHKGSNSIFPECWQGTIIQTLKERGIDAAFERIDEFYATDPHFRANCHDVLHGVGEAAYERYATSHEVTFHPGTAYCGYGFYHGFIETLQRYEGVGRYDQARSYCDELAYLRPETRGTCTHGIGHAVFDSLDAEIWGDPHAMVATALATCEDVLADSWDQAKCASGVYNSFANAMSDRNYFLSYEGFDPRAFCPSQAQAYQNDCYAELTLGYLFAHNLPIDPSLAFIETVESTAIPHLLYVYFASYTKQHFGTIEPIAHVQICTAFSARIWQERCIAGILQGIREESRPQEAFKLSFAVCTVTPDSLRNYCVADVVTYTTSEVRTSPTFIEMCAALPGITLRECTF